MGLCRFFLRDDGAVFSRIAVGDPVNELIPSLLLLILTVVSRYFRSKDRNIVPIPK